ncbi:uncharacterized protein N7484_004168 [Penicillium longicatenatum]|uniref:uncharacterized protein n=1 Tax=Penicillium longicatenatum TaxID=1561947 RepID=UPI0025472E50|nr:uncharacterized protein N7484_004168 [Penicillium longicatenatum]KAJ5650445.1 hypothetical protein N7484_004168 [Penicillium longicatenatum]
MAPMEVPQLHFLSEAAEWLATRSPSTSAHLLGVHTRMLHEELKPLNTHQKKHHCACGSLRKSPKTTQVTRVQEKGKKKASFMGSATVYKCLRCRQRTVLSRQKSLSKPSKPSARPSVPATATTSPIPSTSIPAESSASELSALSDPPKTAENVSSKKRAKTRKKGGLQALLAAKQKSQPERGSWPLELGAAPLNSGLARGGGKLQQCRYDSLL